MRLLRGVGWVKGGASQTRAGLHVDSPGRVNIAKREEEGKGVAQHYGGHMYVRDGGAHIVGI